MTTSDQVPGATSFPTDTDSMNAPEAKNKYEAKGWRSPFFDFVTPSGQTCQLKKLGLTDLMSHGLLDIMNELGVEVDGTIRKAKGQPPVDAMKMLRDHKSLETLAPVIDQILVIAVVQPPISPFPAVGEDRDPGAIYPDHVDLADKVAIMTEVIGDMGDLKSGRKGSKKSA